MSALDRLVPLELSYLTMEDGTPTEKTETWYIYYTMGAVSAMFKKLGVPEQQVREMTEDLKAQDIEDPDEADEYLNENYADILERNVSMTEMEVMAIQLWAGMQWHARQKGVDLSVEDVSHMLDGENLEDAMEAFAEAFQMFQTGDPDVSDVNATSDASGKASTPMSGGER